MEFYLIREQSEGLLGSPDGGSIMRVSRALVVQPEAAVRGCSGADEFLKYLENSLVENTRLYKKLSEESNIGYLRVFMTLDPDPALSSDKHMGSIIISQGKADAASGYNILERLMSNLGVDNVRVNVNVHALITRENFDGDAKFKFEAKDLVIKLVESESDAKDCYGVEFGILPEEFSPDWRANWEAGERLRVYVNLSVVLNHQAVSDLYLDSFFKSELVATNRSVLDSALCSDFAIKAENGVEVKCHRVFLASRSDVFRAMFESKMKEDTSNSMEMEDMSEAAVRALLAYLYHCDLKAASESCEVAFELYRAAEKYNISELESAMATLICAKPDDWFSVDTAIRLLLLARNLKKEDEDGASRVLKKAIRVVKWYAQNSTDKLRQSVEYQQLFETSPGTASEVALLFIQMK